MLLASLHALFKHLEAEVDKTAQWLIRTQRRNPRRLRALLRSHLLREVNAADSAVREEVDQLLSFYSHLELCYATGALGVREDETERTALKVLSIPAVRRYYETYYPLILPSALRLRMEGKPVMSGKSEDILSSLLTQGYELGDDDVDTFLGLLDDYVIDRFNLEDLFAAISRPRQFARRILSPANRDDTITQGARGLVKFLQFSHRFDEFLRTKIDDAELRSAVWHLHAYWYESFGGLIYGALSTIVERFREWAPRNGARAKATDLSETSAAIDLWLLSARRLTTSVYRYPYEMRYLRAVEKEVLRV